MYLKKLDIRGFKSFADSTEIIFNPGLSVIVGPNGCGKSNLVDAIRWVLGESNVRNLRGQKSEDVIFNGSDKSRALGMASVEMILDNSDQTLAVDYGEITVGRRIYRSGESEFYLNKSRVRLKDITHLFTGTGLGKKGYSIISQGELEQVLNGQPFDRRLILEEASGIIKHRQQRDEVNRRIASTSSDLIRISDILGELGQHRQDLRLKADKARQYLDLNQEHQILEQRLLHYELGKAMADLKRKKQEEELRRQKLQEIRCRFTARETQIEEEDKRLNIIRESCARLKDEKHLLQTQYSSLKSEKRLLQERVKNSRERVQAAAENQVKYGQMLDNLNQNLQDSMANYKTEKQRCQLKQQELEKLEADLEQLEVTLAQQDSELEEKKNRVFDRTEEESQVKNRIVAHETSLKRAREKKDRLNLRIDDLGKKILLQQKNYRDLEKQKKQAEKELAYWEEQVNLINVEKASLLSQGEDLEKRVAEINQQGLKISNQLAAIRDRQKNLVGYSPGVKYIMRAFSQGRVRGVLGIAGELISVPSGLEIAIETAGGKGLENILVQSAENAREAISLLKEHKAGRATFLPLDILKAPRVSTQAIDRILKGEGVLGLASRLVDYQPGFRTAVEYLLGRAVVVRDIDSGLRLFKRMDYSFRIVTLEGEIINNSGAMTGGSKSVDNHGPLQRRGEEKQLLKLQEQNQLSLGENQSVWEETSRKVKRLESEGSVARDKASEQKFRREMLFKQMQDINSEVKACQEEKKLYLLQVSQLNREISQLESLLTQLQQKKNQTITSTVTAAAELQTLKEKNDEYHREWQVQKERLSLYQDQLDMKKRELENLKKNLDQFEQVRSSYHQSRKEAHDLKEHLEKEIIGESAKIETIEAQLLAREENLAKLDDEINSTLTDEQVKRSNLETLQAETIPLRKEIASLENNLQNLQIALARGETEFENLQQRWREKFKSEPDESQDLVLSLTEIRDIRKRTEMLYNRIGELGPVDIEAIDQFKEVNQRYEFLKNQYDDLIEARESLVRLLTETEKIMARDLSHFLLLANESFNKTFMEIFRGGEARLRLESAEDCLEAGVEIEVKLPGKKTQPLNLLSGGERALTCIAFIFALLRLKPAPFCLLDEIDAALDETNLVRFSSFLKRMADDIQFIVITHRQATMEAGENLYGVTMPREGISSLLTINLSEAESLAG